MLRIYLTGEVQVENGNRLLRDAKLRGPQGRLVFARLVTERKRAATPGELAEALWPESLPASWTLALSAIVSRLRSGLATVGRPRSRRPRTRSCSRWPTPAKQSGSSHIARRDTAASCACWPPTAIAPRPCAPTSNAASASRRGLASRRPPKPSASTASSPAEGKL